MSVMFGRCHFEGSPLAPADLAKVRSQLAPYAPDGESSCIHEHIGLLFGSFRTTPQSHEDHQPWVTPSGCLWMWDGRLDNRDELLPMLSIQLPQDVPDVVIVANAYEQFGAGCFTRLLGDWALSVWDPVERCIFLARDFLGSRPLYYLFRNQELIWSTVLDPLMSFAGTSFALRETYLAG
jgi:asparagine synthase (glutamine-hydrolysing)